MTDIHNFNAEEFCSSKLWQMVSNEATTASREELEAAVAELAQRRHYLSELEQIGKFDADGN
jgi:hypothetical protein